MASLTLSNNCWGFFFHFFRHRLFQITFSLAPWRKLATCPNTSSSMKPESPLMAHTWLCSSYVTLQEGTCIHTCMSTLTYTYLTQRVLKPKKGSEPFCLFYWNMFYCHWMPIFSLTFDKVQGEHYLKLDKIPTVLMWELNLEGFEKKWREEGPTHPKPEPPQLTEDNFIFKNTRSQWPRYYSLISSFLTSCLFTDVPSSSKSQQPKS